MEVVIDSHYDIQRVTLGKSHAGAIIKRSSPLSPDSTELVCFLWGSNRYGQLGLRDSEPRLTPTEVTFSTGVKDESIESLTISVRD